MFKSMFKPKPPTPEQILALEQANRALRGRIYQMMNPDIKNHLGLTKLRKVERNDWSEASAA